VTVRDVTPPVADAGLDQRLKVNTPVAFDASESHDNVGVVAYAWDYGDGATGTGVTTSHTYATPGIYVVTLTVTDAAGHSDVSSLTVTVEAEPAFPTWALLLVGVVTVVVIVVLYRRILRKPGIA